MTIQLIFSFTQSGKIQLSILQDTQLSQSVELLSDWKVIREQSLAVVDFLLEAYRCKTGNPASTQVNENNLSTLSDRARTLYKTLFGRHDSLVQFSSDTNLAVTLPESLRFIPIELLHSGDQFWCLKYAIVRTLPTGGFAHEHHPSSAFYGFNPSSDPVLQNSEEFRERLIPKAFRSAFPTLGEPRMKHGNALSKSLLIEMLLNRSIVIFTGHGEQDQIPFSRDVLQATDIAGARLDNIHLLLNNSCFSASPNGSLLPAFLSSGLQNFAGFFSKVPQDAAARFTASLINNLGRGMSLGRAALFARREAFELRQGELVWANSAVFGDVNAHFRDAVLVADPLWNRLSKIPAGIRYASILGILILVAFLGFGIGGILQTRKSEENISRQIEHMDSKVSALLAAFRATSGKAVDEPTEPEDFLRNARLATLAGDNETAQMNYRKYFEFGLKYIEPHTSYQAILKESKGQDAARDEYLRLTKNGDPFFVFLEALLEDEHKREQILKEVVRSHADFGPAYGELLKIEINRQINRVRRNEVASGEDLRRMSELLSKARSKAKASVESGDYLRFYLDRAAAKSFGLDASQQTFLDSYAKDSAASEEMAANRSDRPKAWDRDTLFSGLPLPPSLKQTAEHVQQQPLMVSRVYDCSDTAVTVATWFKNHYRLRSEKQDGTRTILTLTDDAGQRSIIVTLSQHARFGVIATITATALQTF